MLPIKRVLLKDHYRGNFWAVEVAKIGSDFFFQAGWTRFLEDNCLEFGDFLVFQYNGDDEFRFKILRSTSESTDINIMGAMDFSPNELLQEVENMEEVVHEGTPTDKKKNISEGEEEEEEEVVVEEVEAEEFEGEILVKNSGKRKVRSSGASATTAKIEENSTYWMANPAVERQKGKNKSKYKDLRSNVNALQNPYFVANYGKNQTNQAYVPRDFGNAFRARLLPPEMVIRDPHGRASSTKFHIRKDKTMWMIGGWRELALQNNVHSDDCLAFELVPMGGDQQGSYIQLHIFRATQGLQNP